MQNDNATVIISSALWDNRDADLEFQIALISLTPNCIVRVIFLFVYLSKPHIAYLI